MCRFDPNLNDVKRYCTAGTGNLKPKQWALPGSHRVFSFTDLASGRYLGPNYCVVALIAGIMVGPGNAVEHCPNGTATYHKMKHGR